jgi:PAS domain S-box-containing protein
MTSAIPLVGDYDYRLVSLSVFIAILAAYAALDLAGRLTTAKGRARSIWLCGGAAAMGIGIWAMHYIGLEAFHLPVVVRYDWPTVVLSLFAAIFASGAALFTVSQPIMGRLRLIAGGIFMGSGIAAMHYIGMEAMRLPAMCVYSPWRVSLSVVLAIAISLLALQLTFAMKRQVAPWSWRKILSALMMGLAIAVMHYVGMGAASFVPIDSMNGSLAHAVDVSGFALSSIAIAALLLLGIVFLTSTIDRYFSSQAQQLAKSELHLQTIFDNMTEGFLVLDREGTIILRNSAATRLLSLPESHNTYQAVIDEFEAFSITGEPLPSEQWPIMRALRGEFVQDFELPYRRRSTGETGTRSISSAPVRDESGEFSKVIITYRDITDRKHLDDARTRLAAIVESSDDAIISKTDGGIVTSWNRGAEKLFGYTAQEMIGQPITCIIPDERRKEEVDILDRIKAGETVDHIETVRKSKSGQSVHVSLTISPIRDASGRIIGASKIARNITERKKLESQLFQSQKMEAIGQLTGGIAHDFNNLLGVIVGNLDLLERQVGENEAALKRVQTAQRAATRGADLIRRLLAFSSNVELRATPTDLNHCVRNLIDWAPALGPDIKIATNLDDALPLVLVDAAGLESALLNLAVNSRDAMPKGGTLTISTALSTLDKYYPPVQTGELVAGHYACISISDTGHGMSRETLSRVFEPFFTTKPHGKGTGLGLSMVYGFSKQSGGIARVYSEPGYGTTLSLYLPFANKIPEKAPAPVPSARSATLGGSVLVVDDEPDLVEIAKTYLEEMGYTAHLAKDGASALELVRQHSDIDLVLTDIVMPGGMNGVELVEQIRKTLSSVKVIYCSGFPASALNERAVSLVDGPLLHKPYQRAEFAAAIRTAMEEE